MNDWDTMPVPHQSLELEVMDSTVSTDNISTARHNKSEEPEEPIPDTRVAAIGHVEAYIKNSVIRFHVADSSNPSVGNRLFGLFLSV
jgi:hypothetical protein